MMRSWLRRIVAPFALVVALIVAAGGTATAGSLMCVYRPNGTKVCVQTVHP
jgi:hypothetical protein